MSMTARKPVGQLKREALRLRFEAMADDYFSYPRPVVEYRLGGSYLEPKLSKAWAWFRMGYYDHESE